MIPFKRVKITPYEVTYCETGLCNDFYTDYYDTPEELFNVVAKRCAFSDIDDGMTIQSIIVNGIEVEYYGWLPDMEIRFVNKNDPEEILWDCRYPEWEH